MKNDTPQIQQPSTAALKRTLFWGWLILLLSAILLSALGNLDVAPTWAKKIAPFSALFTVVSFVAGAIFLYRRAIKPQPKNPSENNQNRLELEASPQPKDEILYGTVVDDNSGPQHSEEYASSKSFHTEEIPVDNSYPSHAEGANGSEQTLKIEPSHKRAHVRFFIEYATYTAAYIAALTVIGLVAAALWNSNDNDRFRLYIIIAGATLALAGLWPLSVMLRRADAKWDASTTPVPQPGVLYSRQLHISVLAHSVLLQAAIWALAFITTSWILNALDTTFYWHFITQLIVTVINVYFVVRTLVDWKLRIVTVTATMFKISRPDILILANTGKRNVNEERRTLIGFAIDERTLTERFAYRTRGTIIIKSQETQDGDTVIQKFPYISNVENLKAALESPSDRH